MEGYLVLQRRVLDDLEQYPCHVLKVYLHCQRRAAFTNREMTEVSTGRQIPIPRGDLIASSLQLAEDLDMSRKQVRNDLTLLQNLGHLHTQSNMKWTRITIIDYGGTGAVSRAKCFDAKGPSKGQLNPHKIDMILTTPSEKGPTDEAQKGQVIINKDLRSKEVKQSPPTPHLQEQIGGTPLAQEPGNTQPETKAPELPGKPANPKELDWIKTALFKDIPLYLNDPVLNAVDPRTGQIAVMEFYRHMGRLYQKLNVFASLRDAGMHEMASGRKRQSRCRLTWLHQQMRIDNWRGVNQINFAVTRDDWKAKMGALEIDESIAGVVNMLAAGAKMI